MTKRKLKKSTWLSLAMLVYISAMAVYFLPRNTEISDTEKYVTLGAAYVIVVVLWIVLRKKEQYKERREKEDHYSQLKNDKE